MTATEVELGTGQRGDHRGRAAARASAAPASSEPRGPARTLAFGLGWTALLAPFAFEFVAIVRASHLALIRRSPDDGFYYLEIATRLSRGQGFTFDGLHSTNGFHPLWQFYLAPLASMFRGDGLIRATAVLGLVCCLIAVLLIVHVVARVCGLGPALLGGVVAVQFGLRPWVNGMEGPVVLLTLALMLTALSANDRPTARDFVVVGLTSALVVLARFDFAVVIGIVPVACWLRWRSWRSVAAWCAGFAALAVPFGTWWLVRWHHLVTTSATIEQAEVKRAIVHGFGGYLTTGYGRFLFDLGRDYLKALEPWAYIDHLPYANHGVGFALVSSVLSVALVSVAVLGTVVSVQRRRTNPRQHTAALGTAAWAVLVVVVILGVKAAVDLVVAPLWATTWYSVPQRLAVGFFVGATAWLGVAWLWQRYAAVACGATAALVLIVVPVNSTTWLHVDSTQPSSSGRQDQIDLAAAWIHDHSPPGVYGAMDAGLLGFQLDGTRSVVNLDGRVNDYRFAALVNHGATLRRRVSSAGVDYLVSPLSGPDLVRLGCGTVLWTSPGTVPYSDALSDSTVGHIDVVDVRSCPAS